jgi:hypothetical protein
MESLARWWRKGETPNCLVYRQPMAVLILTLIAVAIVSFIPKDRVNGRVMAVVIAIFTIDIIFTSRKAVILNETDLVYRPPIGALMTIPLESIRSVEECRVIGGTIIASKTTTRGARIYTTSSVWGYESIPLAVDNPNELLEKLKQIAARNSSRTDAGPAESV